MNISDPSSNTFAIIDGIPVDIESCKIDKEIKQGGSDFMYRLVIRDSSWQHKTRIPNEIILFACRNIFVIFPAVVDLEVDTGEFHRSVIEIPKSWSKRVDNVEEIITLLCKSHRKL